MRDDVWTKLLGPLIDGIFQLSPPLSEDLNQLKEVLLKRHMNRWTWNELTRHELRGLMLTVDAHKVNLHECLRQLLTKVEENRIHTLPPPQSELKGLCILSLGMSYDTIKICN
jgi:hypothetical protein